MTEALLIVNMGGPSGPDAVRPYLREIFADPMILPLPGFFRALVGGMIVGRRSGKVIERYRLVGDEAGGSPLLQWTERQRDLLREAAAGEGGEFRVEHAYRYTPPFIGEALEALAKDGVQRVTLLPLFPHETRAMSGSIRMEAARHAHEHGLELRNIPAWAQHPEILALQADYLRRGVEEAGEGARVLFVAHGIPMRDVVRGDRYPDEVSENAARLAGTLPAGTDWSLAFQSRVGPVRWTEPYLEDELARLKQSKAPVVIMPLSFVSDCLETLFDLDHEAAPELREAGVETVVRVPAYNDDPRFARALLGMVKEMYDG